jgi:hypothetical protein
LGARTTASDIVKSEFTIKAPINKKYFKPDIKYNCPVNDNAISKAKISAYLK